ncbi:thioredoxin domain-containing protein [Vibrio navarrensis]|nr:thioredoxin domain-containing protein [Vibrio navarrensis]
MNNQKKFNIAIAVTCFGLIASNFYMKEQFDLALNQKAAQESVDKVESAMANLEMNMLNATHDDDIKKFIMNNPDVLVKSLAKYRFEQEQKAKAQEQENVKNAMDALFNDPNDPFIGNPNGKKVVVEFIDYNCGYCKRFAQTLEQFIAIEPDAKIIIKEFPIFQNKPTSAYSALIATAIFYYKPELYDKVHHEFMSMQLTREKIDETVASLGIQMEDLKPHMEKARKQIEIVRGLGARLNVNGTPTVFLSTGERGSAGWTVEDLSAAFAK